AKPKNSNDKNPTKVPRRECPFAAVFLCNRANSAHLPKECPMDTKKKMMGLTLPGITGGAMGRFVMALSIALLTLAVFTGCGSGGNGGSSGGNNNQQPVVLYTVTFIANGGSPEPQPVQVQSGKTVSAPATMTRTGYAFDGWYSDSGFNNKFNFASPITQNITLYAKWILANVRPGDLGWTTNTWSQSSTFTVYGNIFTINSNNREDDANFSKVFQVKPKTQYVFSADVTSTAGKSNETPIFDIRASIGVPSGNDVVYDHNQSGWQTLELTVDSGNNTEITFSLRHGYFGNTVNGITQFKNIKLQERPFISRDSNWNFLCLILRNCDVNITVDGRQRNVKITMDNATVDAAKLQLDRFKTAIETMTNRQMTANLEVHVVDTPVTSLSDAGSGLGLCADPWDIQQILKPYLESKNYDHVIAMNQFDKDGEISAPRGWGGLNLGFPIGNLGGKFYDIGYLQMAMTVQGGLAWYYDPSVPAQFYVSGFVHEFAHTAEWISIRKGIEVPDLHDGSYGYTENEDNLGEWYKWLRDYLTCNINSLDLPARKIGCTQETYMLDRYGPSITIYELNELVDP
ncbi:MAG: InlB B-repeat-containing protein, partial [Holophagales bacterium]|nr:InlB B-repeat-containing protein [Holophagales bacterium]